MHLSEREDAGSLSKARKLISEGQTLLVAVDSNAFFEGVGEGRRVSFNRAWMGKLRGLASQGEKLLMSAIWDIEVRRHFIKSIDSQVKISLPKFARIASNSKAISDLNTRAAVLRSEAQQLVEREWDAVKESFNTELIPIPNKPEIASRIFDLWSTSSWPFENRKEKRDEFQDAFALLSLLDYAENLRTQPGASEASILVITADFGCRKFCEQTESLIPCADIDGAVEFLAQRKEILRLAARSIELSKGITDPAHPIIKSLTDSLNSAMHQGFPPRQFSFISGKQEQSGWLRDFKLNSALLLQSGPRGALIEATQDDSDSISIKGRVRFYLTVTLTAPRYAEGTASPSSDIAIENYACYLDADFDSSYGNTQWWSMLGNLPKTLESRASTI